jgi:hypothetical protein
MRCRGAPDARDPSMSNATETIERLWHDHPGARFLVPMIGALVLVLGAIIAMLIYPHAG